MIIGLENHQSFLEWPFYTDFTVHCIYIRALTPLFGNGAGVHGIGKISDVLAKIVKFDMF